MGSYLVGLIVGMVIIVVVSFLWIRIRGKIEDVLYIKSKRKEKKRNERLGRKVYYSDKRI